jgi:hypothetical protein
MLENYYLIKNNIVTVIKKTLFKFTFSGKDYLNLLNYVVDI